MAAQFPSMAESFPRKRRGNPPLLLAGFLMLAALFALANPWNGVEDRVWPWELFGSGDTPLRTQVLAGLWALTALLAGLLSLGGPARLRALALLCLTSVLVLASAQEAEETERGVFALASDAQAWKWILAAGLLGAGLWLGRTPLVSRGLPLVGGLLVVWMFVCTYEQAHDGSASTQLGLFIREWRLLATEPADIGGRWPIFAAQNVLLLASLFAFGVSVGVRWKAVTLVLFCLLALALATLGLAPYWERPSGVEAPPLYAEALRGLMRSGWFLWLVGVFALVDLMRTRPGMDELEVGL